MPRSRTPQERGYDFEKIFGKILGLRVTRGSGNQWFAKGDLAGHAMRGELKHTGHRSFTITKELIRKLVRECNTDEEPFWAIDIDGEVLVVQRAGDWIANRTDEVHRFIEPSKADVKRARSRVPALMRDTDE